MSSAPQMTPAPGTRIVMTGGCGGIGQAVVAACSALKHEVAILDMPQSIEKAKTFPGVRTIEMDGTKLASIEAAIAEAESLLGGIDVLINLIGILNRSASVDELTDAEWDEVMTCNLASVATICRRIIPILRRSDNASIVNVASGLGVRPLAASSVYSVSKAGVIALTKAIAFECAPRIRANSVAPGIVETPFLSGGTGRAPRDETQRYSLDGYRNAVPMKRLGQPADIVGPILFLASPAGSFINGQTIHVNGGGLMP